MEAHFINTPFILFTGNLVVDLYNNEDEVNKFKVLRSKEKWSTTVIAASRLTQVVHWSSSVREYEAIP